MKRLTTMLLCFVALLALSFPVQANTLDGDTPPLFTRTTASKAPAVLSRAPLQGIQNTNTGCDLCENNNGTQLESMTLKYQGASSITVSFRVSIPPPNAAVIFGPQTINPGDLITLERPGASNGIGNAVEIIVNGTVIDVFINGTLSNQSGGKAFHTSCSPGTPKVGDVIANKAANPDYAFEVLGGGNLNDPNACPVKIIDLECDATAAPLLDFENVTDPGTAPEPGDELKFTAPFTNNDANATSPATNVEVTVTYPTSQFTYVSATGGTSQDASTPGEIVFTINSLAPGATETLMFQLKVKPGATAGRVTTSVTAAVEPDVDSTPDNLGLFAAEDDECEVTFQNLPVELVSFEAQADGRSATLAWQTASETNNAGFELQHRYLGEAGKSSSATFTALAFIEGHGTTEAAQAYTFRLEELEPGHHVFRLKQLDYDGTFAYSPEIEVAIDLPEAYLVSSVYPNPFNPQASFSFSVSRSQEVSVAVYNMLGQRVALLFEGVVSEGTSRTLQIDGSALQSGTYLVRVQGASFVNTQTITLVK